VIAPLFLIVMMSCTVFWIDLSNASSRIGVATSAILTLIAYRFVLAGLLPRLPYMTRMDYFTLGSTLVVFLALVEVILASALANGSYVRMAHTIDKYARLAFPILFLLLFGWFLSGLWKYC
jgi:cadmium resistance protein CadD (predicted permease)